MKQTLSSYPYINTGKMKFWQEEIVMHSAKYGHSVHGVQRFHTKTKVKTLLIIMENLICLVDSMQTINRARNNCCFTAEYILENFNTNIFK
jgi:hypothetical protein